MYRAFIVLSLIVRWIGMYFIFHEKCSIITGYIFFDKNNNFVFLVWLQNRLISAVLSHTEKSCIVLHYIQFSTNKQMYNHIHNIKTSFECLCLRHLVANKTIFFIIIHFYIRRKLFIIRCDK